jgi:hypothetical protein
VIAAWFDNTGFSDNPFEGACVFPSHAAPSLRFLLVQSERLSLRLLKPQNIEQEILNVEVKPSKFCGSLFCGSIFKMSRANFKYFWLGFRGFAPFGVLE